MLKWNKNKNFAEKFLAEEFEDLVDNCNDDYPIDGSQYGSNSRYRKLCIEDAAGEALFTALEEWKDEDEYEYFYNRENELVSHFRTILQSKFIGRAVAGQPIIEK